MPIISIIMPVYNAGKYLSRCIESIRSQSFKDWELIIIDDGSNDNSPLICDKYAATDKRIRVIHKENGGVSSARNYGLTKALGEWIYFCDSDDVLSKTDSLKDLYELSSNAQLSVAGLSEIDKNGNNETHFWPEMKFKGTMSQQQYTSCIIDGKKIGYQGFLFTKLFKNEIIAKNKVSFDIDIKYAEDLLFTTRYCCCPEVKKINIDNSNRIYTYLHRDSSAMASWNNSYNENIFTDFIAYERIYLLIKETFDDSEICHAAATQLVDAGIRHLELLKKGKADNFKKQREYIQNVMLQFPDIKEEEETIISFKHMKRQAKKLPFPQHIEYIRQWILSSDCNPRYLTPKWKLFYKMAKFIFRH